MSIRRNVLLPFLSLSIMFFMLHGAIAVGSERETGKDPGKGTVTGAVMLKEGVPLAWGEIMFYDVTVGPPPAPEKYERLPDVSKIIDAEGKFNIKLPEGRYYIGAIKRLSGERFGPLQEGDYVLKSLNKRGKPKEYFVKTGELLDTGTFSGAVQIKSDNLLNSSVTTAIEGTIINRDWKHIADAVVTASVSSSSNAKPLFISGKSDKEGKYVLPVTEGRYYLSVRNNFEAGPPRPGQIVGHYGEGTSISVTVRDCEIISGIDFQVIEFLGTGPVSRPEPNNQ